MPATEFRGTSLERTRQMLIKAAKIGFAFGVVSCALALVAANFDVGILLLHPERLVVVGPSRAEVLRMASLCGLFSFSLAFGVIALCTRGMLWQQGARKMNLLMVAAVVAVVAGGAGAVILAGPGVAAIKQFASATQMGQPGAAAAAGAQFEELVGVVFVLLWQTVAVLGFGCWFAGLGSVLTSEFRLLRGACLVAALGAGVALLGQVVSSAELTALGVVVLLAGWFVTIWFLGREFAAMGPIPGTEDEDEDEDSARDRVEGSQ